MVDTENQFEDPNSNKEDENVLYSTCSGIREYALTCGKSTEDLLEGAIVETAERVKKIAQAVGHFDSDIPTREIALRLAPKVASEVTKRHMSSGLSIPRIVMGGSYELQDVLKAASCIDASVFTREVLDRGFGIKADMKKIRLGVIPNHHYLELENGAIIDPVIAAKKEGGGFFPSKTEFLNRIDAINSGGISLLKKQILNIFSSGQSGNGN